MASPETGEDIVTDTQNVVVDVNNQSYDLPVSYSCRDDVRLIDPLAIRLIGWIQDFTFRQRRRAH